MRRHSPGWSTCASPRTCVRRPVAFRSMSLSSSSLSTTKSVQFKYALMWCVRRHDRDQWRRFVCHFPGIPFQICAAHQGRLMCCRILQLCERHLGHRRRAAEKHLAVRGNMNILFIRRRAKVVHVSCLVSSVFSRSTENVLCRLRYLDHGTLAATEHLWNSIYSTMQYEGHPPSP